MSNSFMQLRRLLTEAAKLSFSWFKQQYPNDKFHAFALMSPDCFSGDPVANSEESLEAAIQTYRGLGYSTVNAGEKGSGEKPWIDLGTLRYCPDEWRFNGVQGPSIEIWRTIWQLGEAIQTEAYASGAAPGTEEEQNGGVAREGLEAMLGAMKDLDDSGFFGVGGRS